MEFLELVNFQRALIGGIMIGFMAPFIGVFVVLRRLSLIGDTLAHVSIAGVALGVLINMYPLTLGVVFALFGALAIEKLRKTYHTYAELSIAIIMSGGIALASIFFTMGRGYNMDVNSFLFGSILTLKPGELWMIGVVAVLTIISLFIFLKELFVVTLDEDAASVAGLPLSFFNLLLTILTALVVSVSIKVVGALLVSALLTIPVACSLIVARSFKQTIWISVLYGEIAVIGGLIAAGLLDSAPGGTIVLLLIVMLLVSLAGKKVLRL